MVIGASAALGVLEAAESSKQTVPLLSAEQLAASLPYKGPLFQLENIKHIDRPSPAAWTTTAVASRACPNIQVLRAEISIEKGRSQ